MKIVALVGLKKCGKTTTAEALIAAFRDRGLHVGSIKFMPNSTITLDVEGKDTWRHRQAGSEFVISLSRGEIGFIGDIKGRATLKDAISLVPEHTDILVCEGLNERHDDLFRILLARDLNLLEETLNVRGFTFRDFHAISGVVTNTDFEYHSIPVFNATNKKDIVDLVDLILSGKWN